MHLLINTVNQINSTVQVLIFETYMNLPRNISCFMWRATFNHALTPYLKFLYGRNMSEN